MLLAKMKREKMDKLRKKWFSEWKKRTNFKKRNKRKQYSKSPERKRSVGHSRKDTRDNYEKET